MGLLFYPRGGSSQVVRYLVPTLEDSGWPVSLVAGSLGEPGDRTHAQSFFKHPRLTAVDYGPALRAHAEGRDPLAPPVPMHPSFEDRRGAADPVFAAVPPEAGDHLTAVWEDVFARAWPTAPDVIHLHHLTHMQEAAARRFPGVPIVTHLHGTELLLLDHIDRLRGVAGMQGTDLAGMAAGGTFSPSPDLDAEERRLLRETRWGQWRHGDHWARRLRKAARLSSRIVAISPALRDEARQLLDVPPETIEAIPNGVDVERFDRVPLDRAERIRRWRRWLVEDPLGWDESGEAGTIRYDDEDLRWFEARDGERDHAPVLLFVGRFTEVKRVPLLVRAYARARPRFDMPAPLVIWGGFTGEYEGEHPCAVAREVGGAGIFFVGWRGHTELPEGLACADVMVAPSAREGFGQMLIEAMACGVPVIATRSGGPVSFVNTDPARPNGWMIEPDDIDALTDALVEAVNDEAARRARGSNGYRQVRATHSWDAVARGFDALYEELIAPA